VKLFYIFTLLLISSCSDKQINLTNTKWRVKKFSIDERNYLTPLEVQAYNQFNEFSDSLKLYQDFNGSLVLTYVQGGDIDTSNYLIRNDTLFFIDKINRRDTDIIIKLSNDSLITHRLAGVTTFLLKQK
jgi:hypothetical protein